MSHLIKADVLELKRQGLGVRDIAKKVGVSKSTVANILKAQNTPPPPGDPGAETPPTLKVATQSERKSDMTIKVTSKQWAEEISPWGRLIYEAAVQQIPECTGLTLGQFIDEALCFVRDFFELKPPGWAVTMQSPLKFSKPPEWDLPQVKAAAEKLAREMENDRRLALSGSTT